MHIDFLEIKLQKRLKRMNGANELIAKAVGFRASSIPLQIIDATAGMGKEALMLASLGCNVTLFERDALVSACLRDALDRGLEHPQMATIISRMTLIPSCFIAYESDEGFKPDVIYCDPMFEARDSSALSKKDITNLKHLIGPTEDAPLLVQKALTLATKRVVVKRRLRAPPLVASPNFCIAGRSHRFDVYLIN